MTGATLSGAAAASPFFGAMQSKLKAQDTSASGSGSTDTNSLSVGNLGTTFLNLLVQELKNQDPTQPMDPTAMVGQMISLNQLDQLISINGALNPASTATTGTTTGAPTNGTTGVKPGFQQGAQASAASAGISPELSALASAALGGNQAALAAMAAQNSLSPSAANSAQPLNLGTLTTLFGGK